MSAAPESFSPSPDTQAFLAGSHDLLINGERVPAAAGERIEVQDPATEATIATVAGAGAEDIDRAVAAARAAFKAEWSTMTAYERARLMLNYADEIERNLPLIAEVEVLENGMPRMISEYTIAKFGAEFMRYYAGWVTKIHGMTIPVSPMDSRNGETLTYTKREPIGVVGAITPWNAPLAMAILKLAPALATGCTIVLKPAELTPLTALLLGELALKAGIPAGVVNVVPGYGGSAGAALAEHPGVDKISFTGSTAVGKEIIRASAGNLKKVTLELGGKSPFVVFPDADLERVIPGAVRGVFFLQGQNCMASTRLFVHEDVFEPVVDGICQMAGGMQPGPGLNPASMLGPLISGQQRERVLGYIEEGKQSAAELRCGGEALPGNGHFLQPTVFARTSMEMKIAREEIFGPVLAVIAYDDEEEAVRIANDSDFGLGGSVWTQDSERGERVARQLECGCAFVNGLVKSDPRLPFGGIKNSGYGRELSRLGIHEFVNAKTIWVK